MLSSLQEHYFKHSSSTASAEAKRLWIVESQLALTQDQKIDIWKKQFKLFLDEHGIWRCGGRLAEADLLYSSKHPALLGRNHPLTTLIIKNAHERVGFEKPSLRSGQNTGM